MSNKDMSEHLFTIVVLVSLISSVFMFFSLLSFGMINDYMFYPVDEIVTDMHNNSIIPSWVLTTSESVMSSFLNFPQYLDYFWLVSFLALIAELFYISYTNRRQGYFRFLSFLSFGIMLLLFVSSIYFQITDWFNTNLYPVLGNLQSATPFFTYYLNHYGTINTIIVIVCVLLNFVDLDFSKFNMRKDKEIGADEL